MAVIRPIPLFGLGIQEKSRPSMAQRRVNLYLERQEDQDKALFVAYRTPGLEAPVTDFGATPARGVIWPLESDYWFEVHRNTFWQVDNAGTRTARGTIGTSEGKVCMATDGRYIGVVDGDKGYYYDMDNPATPIAEITDAEFPDGAKSIDWLAGYWFVEGEDGEWHISTNGSITSWPGDFATAESSPDSLVRVARDHADVALFGAYTTEPWANTGNTNFPFEPIPGAVAEWGLAARHSLVDFDGAKALLAQNKQGQVIAAVYRGYRYQRISNHELESKWAKYGSFGDAVAGSYMYDGHPMYVVSFRIGGETWLYDGSTGAWSQLESYGETRHRAELYFTYQGRTLCTDFENGKVYRLNGEVYDDNGDPSRWLISGRHVHDGYGKMGVDAFQLDIEVGVGLATGQGQDPQAVLRVSRDGGQTFGPERWRSIGAVGKYKTRAIWRKCGRGRDFVFELSGSDPVKIAISGAGIIPRKASS